MTVKQMTSRGIWKIRLNTHSLLLSIFFLSMALLASEGYSIEERPDGNSQAYNAITVPPEMIGRLRIISSVRIVLHTQAQAEKRMLAKQLSRLLMALGAVQVEQRVVDVVPDEHEVRFFHPGDQNTAARVQEALNLVFGQIALRNFTHYKPSPEEKLIEVWL